MSGFALEVTGLRAGYGRSEVLHGVDLRVPSGAVVALLGANGAGKTTLLSTIAGLIDATAGTIAFAGSTIERRPAYERARAGICLIPEGRGIFRELTVAENLAVQVGGPVDDAVERLRARFPQIGERLADRLGQPAGTLSGGEQQMLALARGLLTDPTLVLADELSVGLAPVVVDSIFDALATVREQGASMLIVEQYVERALAIADYVVILHKGRVAFVGEPAQCLASDVFDRYLGSAA
ncbi:MAG: branched-chain amino acid transport system ATP-binding protein [Actinomycetota bacterium]